MEPIQFGLDIGSLPTFLMTENCEDLMGWLDMLIDIINYQKRKKITKKKKKKIPT